MKDKLSMTERKPKSQSATPAFDPESKPGRDRRPSGTIHSARMGRPNRI
jgi:hypothetical protein